MSIYIEPYYLANLCLSEIFGLEFVYCPSLTDMRIGKMCPTLDCNKSRKENNNTKTDTLYTLQAMVYTKRKTDLTSHALRV